MARLVATVELFKYIYLKLWQKTEKVALFSTQLTIKKWQDLEITIMGHSTYWKCLPLSTAGMIC